MTWIPEKTLAGHGSELQCGYAECIGVDNMTTDVNRFALSSEQIQMQEKLTDIFMPEAKRRIMSYYSNSDGSSDSAKFVHYTSAEAAIHIINKKRIWMRNVTCMSDYREVQHGYEILQRYFSDQNKRDAFNRELDKCSQGVGNEATEMFGQLWNNIRLYSYIASISEHKDDENDHGRLSMWRAFGGNAARVAIVFNVQKYSGAAQALNIMFSPVSYLPDTDVYKVIDEVTYNIGNNCAFLASLNRDILRANVFTMLMAGVTCLKHEGFREEREWRVIYGPKLMPSQLIESSNEIIGGIPQTVYNLPLDQRVSESISGLEFSKMFERLIIGPSQYSWALYDAFVTALSKAGVTEAGNRVCISGIPIRT